MMDHRLDMLKIAEIKVLKVLKQSAATRVYLTSTLRAPSGVTRVAGAKA